MQKVSCMSWETLPGATQKAGVAVARDRQSSKPSVDGGANGQVIVTGQ